MTQKHVAGIRAFNRHYTDIIGLVDKYILDSRYSLPEVRVLYELYYHKASTASDIISLLHIDKGYLSRLLRQFEKKRLIEKKNATHDARSAVISLTAAGKKEFELLNRASDTQIKQLIAHLPPGDCDKLLHHMNAIKEILSIPPTINNQL